MTAIEPRSFNATDSVLVDAESLFTSVEIPRSADRCALWQKQKLRRAEILRQARIQLGQSGCSGFSVRRLAADCNTTPQTLHNLIGDRESLILAATAQHYSELIACAQRSAGSAGFFQSYANCVGRHTARNRSYVLALTRALSYGPSKTAMRLRQMVRTAFENELRRLADSRCLREGIEIPALALRMQALTRVTAHDWAEEDDDCDALRRGIADGLGRLLLGALRPGATAAVEAWLNSAGATEG